MRTFLVMAWTSIGLLGFSFGSVSAVFLERTRGRKFAETMADHIFGNEHRREDLAVVNVEGDSDEVRSNHGATRPRFDRSFGFSVFGLLDFLHEVKIHERAFFD